MAMFLVILLFDASWNFGELVVGFFVYPTAVSGAGVVWRCTRGRVQERRGMDSTIARLWTDA